TLQVAEAEVERTLAGAYGEFLPSCSWLIEEEDGALASACLVTYFEEWRAPIVAFVMTAPEAKGSGMAQGLIARSMNAALAQGYRQLCLAVTEGNTPAERAYAALGFEVTERWER